MTLFLIKCLSVWFLILVQFSVFSETKPTLDPNATEIYLNELQELEITCTGDRPLIFSYPSESTEYIARSQEIVREYQSGSQHMITFLRKRALHGDTGWYNCAYRDNEEDLTRVYVYVKSTENFFVGNETIIIIHAVENHALELPCRPTSPDYQVQLMRGDDEVIEEGENVIFDKTKGFTIKRVRLTDNGHLKCVIEIDGNTQEKLFLLTVIGSEPTVAEPTIIKDPLRHVTEGQKLRVNCTVEVNKNTPHLLNWTTPRQDNRITSKLYLIDDHGVNSNIQLAVCELQIDGVIEEDAGEYVCSISTFLNSASTSINLKVHDSYSKYINLETERRNYTQHEYESIQWVVYIDAYPQPEIIWLDPHGNKIINSSSALVEDKYIIYNTETTSTLKINKLEVKDKGNYILRAEHPRTRMIETLNFTLDVLAKPVTIISENIHKFYMPGDIAEIYCHAAGNPNPQITWSFRKIDGSSTQILNNTEEHLEETSRNSTVRLIVESTGNITCSASNNLGYDNVERPILMTDVLEGFGVIPPKNEVIVGDKVELICAASVYNYTDEVEWLDSENFAPVTLVPGRIDVKKEKTLFTHRAVLTINIVKKSDGKTYVCSSKSKSEIIEKKDYTLKVYDPQLPFFVETNMNNTKTIFPIGKSNLRSISLTCYAEGMPKPEITWWKDNIRIEINNQSKTDMCEYKSVNSQLLYIDYLYENCSGEYRCKAKNRFGSVEASINMVFEGIIKGHEGSAILKYSLVILVIICIIMAISFSIKMHREKVLRKMLMEAGLTHFEEGALECLNPELSVDHQAELLPYDRRWEFPRDKLKFGKQLGCGAFGVVMKAEAQGICEGEVVTTVAVKMVRRLSESTYIRALVSELKIMVHLGKHLNVVNLLGACTKNIAKRELLVIVEYCRFGNLHNYLLRHRSEFINQIDSTTGKIDISIGSDLLTRSGSNASSNRMKYASLSFPPSHSMGSGDAPDSTGLSSGPDSRGLNSTQEGMVLTSNSTQPGWRSNYRGDYKDQGLKPICTQDLLSWAFQVARGMEYLSQRKVLHGDLAARNILLAEDNVVKICDFGLAKTMYKDDNYKKTGDAPLPIKWMAIESIRDRVFSTQSDIWSYGIVLWEFFTLAETPYPGMEAEKQYLKLIEGYRMEKPEFATQDVYDIMFQCWKAKPILRPTFTELVKSIGDLLDESVKMHYVDLNTPYLDMNTLFHDGGKNDYLTMMSSPDHHALSSPAPGDYVNAPRVSKISTTDDSYLCMSPTSRKSESGIFSPTEKTHFEFPNHETPVQIHSDSDSEPVELSPMLKSEDDNYLKPINVHERRAEFARQREAMKIAEKKKLMERDSGYCNTPHNLVILDVHGEHSKDEIDFPPKLGGKNVDINNSNGYLPGVIRATDNIPKQKNDLRKNLPDSYSNPSYQIMRDENFQHSNA